ncbi:MAG: hypothetical protein H0U74_18710 [Bradymonadaceae bacterium]|nr:hypothetical protein [Lujinxingiaceae bacterium]
MQQKQSGSPKSDGRQLRWHWIAAGALLAISFQLAAPLAAEELVGDDEPESTEVHEEAQTLEVTPEPEPEPEPEPQPEPTDVEAQPGIVPLPEVEALAQVPEDAGPSATALRVDLQPEYRVRSLRIDPVELSGEGVRGIDWTEQRFRLNTALVKPTVGSITIQIDALDGVLFGDNGSFLGTPASNSGVSLSTKRPNLTRWDIGLKPGADPLDRNSYVPVLREAPLFEFNYLYGDILLPIGVLRIGRQPLNYGATITAHDGGRHNRWGASSYSDGVDRILFGTKLDQAWGVIRDGEDHVLDASLDNGVILGLFYDFLKQDNVAILSDDLRQFGTQLQFRLREANWLGWDWRNLAFLGSVVHIRNEQFNSSVFGFPMLLEGRVENFGMKLQYMHIRGSTREISEGFGALSGKEATDQDVIAHGAQAVLDYDLGRVNLAMELNYASGDDNPRPNDPITSFNFARDMNVGLLLFEHIVAFESARSVAVGIENLSGTETASFPLTEARTEGRFTNAIVVFPQVKVDWWRAQHHNIHTRMGVMMAWSAATLGVVDPIMTSINDLSANVADNAVNYHGGLPSRYYGTEFDLQVGYRFRDNFFWTFEAAMLLPGQGVWDEHGDAVRSFLLENRFEFLF